MIRPWDFHRDVLSSQRDDPDWLQLGGSLQYATGHFSSKTMESDHISWRCDPYIRCKQTYSWRVFLMVYFMNILLGYPISNQLYDIINYSWVLTLISWLLVENPMIPTWSTPLYGPIGSWFYPLLNHCFWGVWAPRLGSVWSVTKRPAFQPWLISSGRYPAW